MDIRNITEADSFQENLLDDGFRNKSVIVGNVIVNMIVSEGLDARTGKQSGTGISINLNPQHIDPTQLGFNIITPDLRVDNIEITDRGTFEYSMTDKGTYRLIIKTDEREYKFVYENSFVAYSDKNISAPS